MPQKAWSELHRKYSTSAATRNSKSNPLLISKFLLLPSGPSNNRWSSSIKATNLSEKREYLASMQTKRSFYN